MKKIILVALAAIIFTLTMIAASASNVIITPSEPLDNNDLTCSVLGNSEVLDYYWYKNGQEIQVDYDTSSVLSSLKTSSNDLITCKAFTPFGNKVGEVSVRVDSSVTGTVTITPSNPRTDDDLRGYVSGSSDEYDYYWYKNGGEEKVSSGTESSISADETVKNEVWTLKVYTPLYNNLVGESSVTILNSAPVIASVSYPSTISEGQNAVISFTATDADNDHLDYSIYMNSQKIADSRSITFSGTPGVYNFELQAEDGEETASRSISITVTSGSGGNTTNTTNYTTSQSVSQAVKIKDVEFSSINGYLKIRNKGTNLNNVKATVYFEGINSIEKFSFDLKKNAVVYKVLSSSSRLQKNKTYLAKIEIKSRNFEDSGYILVKR